MKRRETCWLVAMGAFLLSGCGLSPGAFSVSAVLEARAGLDEPRVRLPVEEEEVPEQETRKPSGSVFLGELLAFFPGLIVPGVGHYYAGDYRTASRLLRIGEFGYLLTAVGGGIGIGGYYLHQKESQTTFAYSLYATGGVIGTCGIGFVLTAWIYDMVDTPRAVRTGGTPPPRSSFVDSLDIF